MFQPKKVSRQYRILKEVNLPNNHSYSYACALRFLKAVFMRASKLNNLRYPASSSSKIITKFLISFVLDNVYRNISLQAGQHILNIYVTNLSNFSGEQLQGKR